MAHPAARAAVHIMLLWTRVAAAAGDACAETCFGASCDRWDGGAWGTCADLEATYGCDCSGCDCDGSSTAS